MPREFDTFVDDPKDLPEMEVSIAIRELTPDDRRLKYKTRYVKALVSKSKEKIEGADVLYLRWQRGRLQPGNWYIKILEELGEYLPKETRAIT